MKNKVIHLVFTITVLCMHLQPQAQECDTLPYNVGVPQFFIQHPLDSIHVLLDGSLPLIVPELGSMCVTQEQVSGIGRWAPAVYVDFNNGDYALGFHSDTALTVIGMAWVDWVALVPSHNLSGTRRFDSAEVRLYTPEGNDMIPFASKRIRFDTTVVDHVYAPYRGWEQTDADYFEATVMEGTQTTYPLFEVFFDREFDMTDSFYVSVKYWSTYIPLNRVDKHDFIYGWTEWFINAPNYGVLGRRFPAQSYMIKYDASSAWQYGVHQSYPLLFPIVRRECDSCPEVQRLRWSRLGSGTTAFVQWDAGVNHRDWQLSYGPTGTPAGEGTVVDCPPAQCVLPGLAAGVTYDIYVRARCRFARDEWTGWSGPLEVGFGSPGEGIDEAAGVVSFTLRPNPAREEVTLEGGAWMAGGVLTVTDMRGTEVVRRKVESGRLTLDVSRLPKGAYTVSVTTSEGTAARRLVVQ